MIKGATFIRGLILILGLSVSGSLFMPVHAEETKKTRLEICSNIKSKPHSPTRLANPKNLKPISTMTIVTNCGNIVIALESKTAPVTISKLNLLAVSKYFDGTLCHRLTTSGIYVLQCGDPTATGRGMPAGWKGFVDENLPGDFDKNYPAGTVAMANSGPNTNGSQFFLVYKDSKLPPNYTIWGKITSGLDLLIQIGEVGAYQVNKNNKRAFYAGDGYPIQPIEIRKITVS